MTTGGHKSQQDWLKRHPVIPCRGEPRARPPLSLRRTTFTANPTVCPVGVRLVGQPGGCPHYFQNSPVTSITPGCHCEECRRHDAAIPSGIRGETQRKKARNALRPHRRRGTASSRRRLAPRNDKPDVYALVSSSMYYQTFVILCTLPEGSGEDHTIFSFGCFLRRNGK